MLQLFKKTSLLACLSLCLSGCSLLGALTTVEYNNAVVEDLNLSSNAIQATATAYNQSIPEQVTETMEISTSEMKESFAKAEKNLTQVKTLQNLESRNIEQQNAVRLDLKTYQTAAQKYLERYQSVLEYYQNKTYVQDVNKVEILDDLLHTDYTTFIQANNALVSTLDKFVDKSKQALP